MSIAIMGLGIEKAMALMAFGHLGSALFLLFFFELISPLIEKIRGFLGYLWIRIKQKRGLKPIEERSSVPFQVMTPGSKYYLLGAVAFVFAFGSFVGVAATKAVNMKRSRAFAAVLIGCGISVVFWSLVAYYLSRTIKPWLITLVFLVLALALLWRGKILENRFMSEIRKLGIRGVQVLYLMAYEASPRKIAARSQMGIDEITKVLEELRRKGYVTSVGQDIYELTSRGLDRAGRLPGWLVESLKSDEEEGNKDETDGRS